MNNKTALQLGWADILFMQILFLLSKHGIKLTTSPDSCSEMSHYPDHMRFRSLKSAELSVNGFELQLEQEIYTKVTSDGSIATTEFSLMFTATKNTPLERLYLGVITNDGKLWSDFSNTNEDQTLKEWHSAFMPHEDVLHEKPAALKVIVELATRVTTIDSQNAVNP